MKALTVPFRFKASRLLSEASLYGLLDLGIIFCVSLAPLLVNLPYRVNIFLSYEGAYRLYLGQIPFQDFGMPLGYGYFLLPAFFFVLLGPYLSSLVAAQAFLNIVTLFSFRSILKLLGVRSVYRTIALLVFCLSFTFAINFWPWYNNSAFVYGMFGLNFLLFGIFRFPKKQTLFFVIAGFFTALSLFTKQDFGGLWLVACSSLILLNALYTRKINGLFWYALGFGLSLAAMILPLIPYDFLYWFNYGQAPHDSRLHISSFLNEWLSGSDWEKVYLFLTGLVLYFNRKTIQNWQDNKQEIFLYAICLGMVVMALITKVTSRLPVDTSTYFHGFALALLLFAIGKGRPKPKPIYAFGLIALSLLWWSDVYWGYAMKVLQLESSSDKVALAEGENAEPIKWVLSDYPAFEGVYLPEETVAGIERIKELPAVQDKAGLKVLNMSELTPLAHELGYEPMINQPLWYHLNIGMFDEQVDDFKAKVAANTYDLVLFEDIPSLTEFYPYEVQESLQTHYQLADRFLAPRKLGDSYIEVYVRKP